VALVKDSNEAVLPADVVVFPIKKIGKVCTVLETLEVCNPHQYLQG